MRHEHTFLSLGKCLGDKWVLQVMKQSSPFGRLMLYCHEHVHLDWNWLSALSTPQSMQIFTHSGILFAFSSNFQWKCKHASMFFPRQIVFCFQFWFSVVFFFFFWCTSENGRLLILLHTFMVVGVSFVKMLNTNREIWRGNKKKRRIP